MCSIFLIYEKCWLSLELKMKKKNTFVRKHHQHSAFRYSIHRL